MSDLLTQFEGMIGPAIRAMLIVIAGLIVSRLVNRSLRAVPLKPQQQMLLRRVVSFGIIGVTLVWGLSELGFDLGIFLGAAGILTVALGFASQTSASNFISGLFLVFERPFVVGDIITVEDTTGEVLSIDFVSVKLRTFDNLLVRIPNETLLKSRMTNVTHFPIRRYDLKMGVAYKEDLKKVREVLVEVANDNPVCLQEPPPLFIFLGFGDSSLDFQFSVWASTSNYLSLRNTMHENIKDAFDAAGIEIPFPHRTLYAGSVTSPFPVQVVDGAAV
jgi:small-conductance mechanosensitive channel